MSVMKRARDDLPFTPVANEAARDARLELAALGLLTYMLSFPPDWQFHVPVIVADRHIGRDKAYALIRQLIGFGYIERVQARNEHGQIEGFEYIVRYQPLPENQEVDVTSGNDAKPQVGTTYGKSGSGATSGNAATPQVAATYAKSGSGRSIENKERQKQRSARGRAETPQTDRCRHGNVPADCWQCPRPKGTPPPSSLVAGLKAGKLTDGAA